MVVFDCCVVGYCCVDVDCVVCDCYVVIGWYVSVMFVGVFGCGYGGYWLVVGCGMLLFGVVCFGVCIVLCVE